MEAYDPQDYEALFRVNPQPLVICDEETHHIRDANEAALRLFGTSHEVLVGNTVVDFVDDDDKDALLTTLGRVSEDDRQWGPWHFHGASGEFRAVCERRRIEFGGRPAFIVYIRDVTRQLEYESQLRESERRYAMAVQGANDGIWDWDLITDKVYFSARFCELLGYEEGGLGETPGAWLTRVHPEDVDRLRMEIELHRDGATPRLKIEYRVMHRDGHYVWMLTRGVAVREEGRAVRMAGSQSDITERKADEERILQGTFYDRLTGLANRLLFLDRLEFLVRRAAKNEQYGFTVLLLDLDRFKMVNEGYGHAAGDDLLIEAGKRLSRTLGPGDTLARLGGDEFGVLIDGVSDIAASMHHAQTMLDVFDEPFELGKDMIPLGISVGVVVDDGTYARSDDMLRDADTAMYRAKGKGRGRYEVFDEKMHHAGASLLRTEADIRRGLEDAEFELYYQPIISLSDGSVVGSEALVRWNHAERGLLMPGAFIPIAEESGLIVPLGEWIMNEACRQCKEWEDRDLEPGGVSVNLSAHQLKSGRVRQLITGALERSGLDGRRLHIELTESAVMEDPEQAIAIFRDLAELGVRFEVDDFGTGYSSMSYLKRFRFSSLKIDRSFVQDVAGDAESAALVAAVIAMAHSFRAQCVGEGVETTEQLSYLRLLKCDNAQGYLFSRPVPAGEFEQILRTGSKGWNQPYF